MKILITPSFLSGEITPPPSKSMAHRLLICAALADGRSVISNIAFSDDVVATLTCMKSLGADWRQTDASTVAVDGTAGRSVSKRDFECGESGSTLRFLIPIALALCGGGRFTGKGRLMQRPLGPYFDLFMENGVCFSYTGDALEVRGKLSSGCYPLRGDVSSQFFSGLLFALPLADGDSLIRSTTKLESMPYIEMTLAAQSEAGIINNFNDGCFEIRGGRRYAPFNAFVEADWSQAAFWIMANCLGSSVKLCGMNENSPQGDRRYALAIAEMFGNEDKKELEFDISDCPDLLPPVAAAAALRKAGCTTRFFNAARLRLKESDRLASVSTVLRELGGVVDEEQDAITVHGVDALRGGVDIFCHRDHRIAMMAAIAATRCEKPIVLDGAECVNKSYPSFWHDYRLLGGKAEEI